jgi:acetyl esterase
LLDFLRAAGRPKTWQLSPPEAREGLLALAKLADAKDVPIGMVLDGAIRRPASLIRYRSYTPHGPAGERLPALVYFHGGGFVIGSLDTHDGFCRLLANASACRVIAIDYRLAPEHRFPAGLDDCYAAVRYVAEHPETFGIDPDRLAVGGDSAGGNLAAVVCLLAKLAATPAIALQLLLCPITDAQPGTASRREYAEGFLLENASIDWFLRHYLPTEADLTEFRISPLRAPDLSGLPPAHIHTAEFDPLRDEGAAYADRLKACGVNVHYVCHTGMIHHFYALAESIPYGRRMLHEAGRRIKEALA